MTLVLTVSAPVARSGQVGLNLTGTDKVSPGLRSLGSPFWWDGCERGRGGQCGHRGGPVRGDDRGVVTVVSTGTAPMSTAGPLTGALVGRPYARRLSLQQPARALHRGEGVERRSGTENRWHGRQRGGRDADIRREIAAPDRGCRPRRPERYLRPLHPAGRRIEAVDVVVLGGDHQDAVVDDGLGVHTLPGDIPSPKSRPARRKLSPAWGGWPPRRRLLLRCPRTPDRRRGGVRRAWASHHPAGHRVQRRMPESPE